MRQTVPFLILTFFLGGSAQLALPLGRKSGMEITRPAALQLRFKDEAHQSLLTRTSSGGRLERKVQRSSFVEIGDSERPMDLDHRCDLYWSSDLSSAFGNEKDLRLGGLSPEKISRKAHSSQKGAS
jgi:hypothetical protein